jgi:nucleotide-binding universal stress UspA family protein
MSAQHRPSVVVGIDGSRDGVVALDWAVRHAARRHWPIRGIHVVDHSRRPSPPALERDDGSEILDDAAAELARLDYSDATLETRHGNPAEVLLEVSRDTSLLVIGRRGAGGFAELVMGSTSQVCAALAPTALVVVPDCWQPDGPQQGQVVVGVDGSSSCQDALGFGFEIVSLNASDLVAVNAADVPERYPRPDVGLDRDNAPWQADARRLMGEALAGWAEKYPDVRVRTQYVAGHPVQVLARASETADLVVVGGLGRTKFTPLRMGSVSRGLLHHTRCPVAVIHGGVESSVSTEVS